jgi:hypothetical protein
MFTSFQTDFVLSVHETDEANHRDYEVPKEVPVYWRHGILLASAERHSYAKGLYHSFPPKSGHPQRVCANSERLGLSISNQLHMGRPSGVRRGVIAPL